MATAASIQGSTGTDLRHTGIHLIGDVNWGTHFCQFYRDPQDLIDILVPYFKSGLENNEFCMWVTSEPLRADEAKAALAREVEGLEQYIARGQIEILDYSQWYTAGGKFESDRVLQGWVEREERARQRGFDGLRLTGNTFWLEKSDWQSFTEYEATVDGVIGQYRMLAICTYSLAKCGADEVMDVLANHAFALIKRAGGWQIIESAERKRMEASLRETEARYRELFESMDEGFALCEMVYDESGRPVDFRYLKVNPTFARLTGFPVERVAGHTVKELIPGIEPFWLEAYARVVKTGCSERFDHEVAALGKHYEIHAWPSGEGRFAVLFSDVTERKRTEDRLRESEKRRRIAEELRAASRYARSLIEASLDPLVTISTEGKITDVNQATELATGVPRALLTGTRFSDYFTAPSKAEEGYHKVLSEGLVRDYPLTIRHVDGHTTDVVYNAAVYRNEAGEVQGVFAAARDVTERNRMEEQLRATNQSLEQLAAIVESSDDAIIGKTLDGRILSWNHGAERLYGYAAQEVLGKTIACFVPPERLNEVPRILERMRRGERVEHYETVRMRKDGRHLTVSLTVSPIRDAGGGIVGASTIARDITERKRMEEEVRAASLYARSLIEASLDPLVTISPEGRVTDVNEATELVTGVPRDRLIGSSFSDYFTEPHKAEEGYQKVLGEGLVRDYPLTIRHVDGRTTDVLYNAVVYRNEAGHVQGVFAAARDVTERKRVEAELARYRDHLEELVRQRTSELETANARLQRTTAELVRSNQDLEQFAYVSSHDLQEPLRMVTGFMQLLEKEYRGKLDSQADEYIRYAADGAKRMQQLIDDLLAYSRVGSKARNLAPTATEQVLNEALANLRVRIGESEAEIVRGPLPTVLADGPQLVQVFQNLISNAIKFRGKDTPKISVEARRDGASWVFSVKDNGIGIEPEFQEKVFMIFKRLHTKEKYPGTGIGLAVCKKIVERHRGRIWVESGPGQGSTFCFSLPA